MNCCCYSMPPFSCSVRVSTVYITLQNRCNCGFSSYASAAMALEAKLWRFSIVAARLTSEAALALKAINDNTVSTIDFFS